MRLYRGLFVMSIQESRTIAICERPRKNMLEEYIIIAFADMKRPRFAREAQVCSSASFPARRGTSISLGNVDHTVPDCARLSSSPYGNARSVRISSS